MFDWSAYLRLAEELAQRHDDEGALRSAISRAYYAVFNIAAARCDASGPARSLSGGTHEAVWNAYRRSKSPAEKAIGNWGDRLRRQRTKADYDDSFQGTLRLHASGAVEDATKTVEAIAALP